MTNRRQSDEVLDKAAAAACEKLGLNLDVTQGREISEEDLQHIVRGDVLSTIEFSNKIKCVKIYTYLISLVGSDEAARLWMNSTNSAIAGIPAMLMETQGGLDTVFDYLQTEHNR